MAVWEFYGSKNVLYYFGLALKQAATDGGVVIQGRSEQTDKPFFSESLSGALADIPRDYFIKRYIDHGALHAGWMTGVNRNTRASDVLGHDAEHYSDLHVFNPQAWVWLKGRECRAARDKAMEEERVRRKAMAHGSQDDACP